MIKNNKTLYGSIIVAKHFISLAQEEGKTLTPLYLLKIVYLCHCWHLGIHGYGLISDFVLARKHGPIIDSLYNIFIQYRSRPLVELIDDYATLHRVPDKEKFIQAIWNRYKHLEPWELTALSHREGSPWDITVKTYGVDAVIPDKIIQQHYEKLVNSLKANPPLN